MKAKNVKRSFMVEIREQFFVVVVWKKRPKKAVPEDAAWYKLCRIGKKGRERPMGILGVLHLVYKRYGSGLVAHELLHIVRDWQELNQKLGNEEECDLLQQVTNAFWNAHYKEEG